MSANNQQQQADPSAAVAAPAASSEYLKRTCLICGCHTNQTINIYEPRSAQYRPANPGEIQVSGMDFPRKTHLTNVGSVRRGCGHKEIDIGATNP